MPIPSLFVQASVDGSRYIIFKWFYLRSIGDDKVGGVNVVNEGSAQVDCTSACVGHLLLGPGFNIHW